METPNKQDNSFKITGNWDEQAKQLKENFPTLTDADLKFEAGKENELLASIGTRLNKKRDEVIGLIKKAEDEKVPEDKPLLNPVVN